MTMMKHTPGPWTLNRRENAKYPDLPTFDVLAPNPDRGKEGVSYAGRHLSVAVDLDSEADATLIAAAPQMLAVLARIYRDGSADHYVSTNAGRSEFHILMATFGVKPKRGMFSQ